MGSSRRRREIEGSVSTASDRDRIFTPQAWKFNSRGLCPRIERQNMFATPEGSNINPTLTGSMNHVGRFPVALPRVRTRSGSDGIDTHVAS